MSTMTKILHVLDNNDGMVKPMPPAIKATLTYHNPSNNESQIEVGTHNIQYGGSSGDGFCYTHQNFDCELTEQEKSAVRDIKYPAEFFSKEGS